MRQLSAVLVLIIALLAVPSVAGANPVCGALPGPDWTWQTSEGWGAPFTITQTSGITYRGNSGNGVADVKVLVLQHRLLLCTAVAPDGSQPIPTTQVVLDAVIVAEEAQSGGQVCFQSKAKQNQSNDCRAPAGR